MSGLRLSSKHLVGTMNKMGLEALKSKFMGCKVLEFIPDTLLNHFVRGYFDGDGHVGKYGTSYQVGMCGTPEFLACLRRRVECLLGMSIYLNHRKNYSNFRVHGFDRVIRFYDFMYKDASVFLERKHDIFVGFLDNRERLKNKYRYIYTRGDKWIVRLARAGNRYSKSFNNEDDAVSYALNKGLDIYGRYPLGDKVNSFEKKRKIAGREKTWRRVSKKKDYVNLDKIKESKEDYDMTDEEVQTWEECTGEW